MSELESKSEAKSETKLEARPANNAIADKKRNPYTVWFVVMAFIAPVVLAYIMFYFVGTTSFINHGEILNPIVNIVDFELTDDNNEAIDPAKLTYKWRLISFVGKNCDSKCVSRLFDIRQIHTSLGKNQHRLNRMFIHTEPAGDALEKLIADKHENVIRVNGDRETIEKVLGVNVREGAATSNNETYIMDPMGNVMMRFTQEQPNKEFLYDLKKLLKASQIG